MSILPYIIPGAAQKWSKLGLFHDASHVGFNPRTVHTPGRHFTKRILKTNYY